MSSINTQNQNKIPLQNKQNAEPIANLNDKTSNTNYKQTQYKHKIAAAILSQNLES